MRILLIFVAAIVVIILGLWATLVLYFDEARLKQIATEQVRAQTGRELVIDGPLKLKVFPRISLVANDVELSGPDNYSGPELFAADQFSMSLSLMPLIRGEVETGDITLAGAELNLHTDSGGRSTLDGLVDAEPGEAPESPEPAGPAQISTGTIRLDDVDVIVSDAAAGTRQVFVVDRLQIEPFQFDQAIPFEFEGVLGDPAVIGDLDMSGSVTVPSGAGPLVIQELSFSGDLSGTRLGLSGNARVEPGPPMVARFSEGQVELGENQFNVAFSYTEGGRPKIDAVVDGEMLDVDALLATMPAAETEAEPEETESPLLLLRDIDMDADLTLERMKISGLELGSIIAQLRAVDGVVTLDPLSGALQGGRMDAVATADLNAEPPEVQVSPVFQLESLGQALSAWGVGDYLSGMGSLALDLSARGLDFDSVLKTLDGQGQYDFRNGGIQGLNLDGMVDALAARNISQAVSAGVGGTTEFKTFVGDLVIEDGTIRMPGLELITELLGVTGDARVGLADLSLDGLLRLNSERLERLPLELGGTLNSPKLTPDVGEALKDEAGRRVRDFLGRGGEQDDPDDGG